MSTKREWDRGKEWSGHKTERRCDEDILANDSSNWKRKRPDSTAGLWSGGDIGKDPETAEGYSARSNKRKKHIASEPSPHVIFLGLDLDFTEKDLFEFLVSQGCEIENITIIRERTSGLSKGFGFAQFKSISAAQAFVEPNFPFVAVPTSNSENNTEFDGQHPTRRVKIDYSQSISSDKPRRDLAFSNDGTRDIGNTRTAVLLLRGLGDLTTPDAIVNALGVGARIKGLLERVIVVQDKRSQINMGFAFVEFSSVQHACEVLAKIISPKLFPQGFRIGGELVAASFAHHSSFQIVPAHGSMGTTGIPSSIALGGVDGCVAKYWDDNATLLVSQLKPVNKVVRAVHMTSDVGEGQPSKKEIAQRSLDVPIKLNTTSDFKQPLSIKLKPGIGTKIHKQSGTEDVDAVDLAEVKPTQLLASKKAEVNISKWSVTQRDSRSGQLEQCTDDDSAEPQISLIDPKTLTCILCSRQFRSTTQLNRHEAESSLHKANLNNTDLLSNARDKIIATAQYKDRDHAQKYRDRALERRVLHNQPERPNDDQLIDDNEHDMTGSVSVVENTVPQENIGNRLLKRMGWTEGSGLGSNSDGIAEPIPSFVYVSGAGLGSAKAKQVQTFSNSSGIHMSAKDMVKERYESIG